MTKENPQLILGEPFIQKAEELMRRLYAGEINFEEFNKQLWNSLSEQEFVEQLQNWDRNPFK